MDNPGFNNIFVTSLDRSKDKVHISLEASSTPKRVANEFVDDGEYIIFKGKYMEVYVSEYYFEKDAAELIGTDIKTLAVLNYRTFQDIDGKKPNPLKVFNLPIQIMMYPSAIEDRTIDLVGKGKEKYKVLKFYTDDKLCQNVAAANKNTFVLCMNIILSGKLPPTIPYNAIYEIWDTSYRLNDVSFDIPDLVKELIIAQVYRDPKNIVNTFGSVLAKNPRADMYGYKAVDQRTVASAQSAFNGLIFEDYDRMLISGINGTREHRRENISPMEEIMKY